MAASRSEGGIWGGLRASGATPAFTRVGVTVTFLRQDRRPDLPSVSFPAGYALDRVAAPDVPLYRTLYNTVGAAYVWWLRRTMPDAQLAELLANPGLSIHVLSDGEGACGFYELDRRPPDLVNLSYFGLMPRAVGRGLGAALLHAALADAWAGPTRAVTVNTCTADHRRALPNYLAAGFRPVRSAREVWDVPNHLRLNIPDHLRA